MQKILDQQERDLALDPTQSFIVQAPAGSGKTTLLTKRFLTLLTIVEQPEQILAITFTKKAAAEMRDRILEALSDQSKVTEPTLIQKVLERNQTLQWHLLENPHRLKIQTIDAFSAALVKQMPLLSGLGLQSQATDHPEPLYEEAINQLFDNPNIYEDMENICLHLDNQIEFIKNLFIDLLKKRDQWLDDLVDARSTKNLRELLEKNLKGIQEKALKDLNNYLPNKDLSNELFALFEFSHPEIDMGKAHHTPTILPTDSTKKASTWLQIADWLLTKVGSLRKTMNKQQGFPAPSSFKNKEEKAFYQNMKTRVINLLEALQDEPSFIEKLAALRQLPAASYTDQQWQVLTSLIRVLELAVAELRLVFQQHQTLDFTEIALGALQSLGESENPTDLGLTLDYKIHHLLIDEFQDTSITQYRLLEKLIQEWEPDDGRTLFLVGDPMQSIYRFRNANVGLFIRAQQEGVQQIALTPLRLKTNFRASSPLIQWINRTFSDIFPKEDHISSGAVSYHAMQSPNTKKIEQTTAPHIDIFSDDQLEANYIVEQIQTLQERDPTESIAVLVRARDHARTILQQLRQAGISYAAVDMDPLASRPMIQDLFSLTKAIAHIGDRIAWLSILRAPWCGLTLNDLHSLVYLNPKNTIWANIQQYETSSTLSDDGKERLSKLRTIFKQTFQNRAIQSFRDLIENTWITLDGPACLSHLSDIEDSETFFKTLSEHEIDLDFIEFEQKLNKLFAATQNSNALLEIMTIHKSKGLEFDTVIIPKLHKSAKSQDPQLLLWKKFTTQNQTEALILAPIKAYEHDQEPIQDYLKHEEKKQSQFEDQRLFYVATTRAKKRLILTGVLENLENDEKERPFNPPKGSFLAYFEKESKICRDALHVSKNHHSKFKTIEARRAIPLNLERYTFNPQKPLYKNSIQKSENDSSCKGKSRPEPIVFNNISNQTNTKKITGTIIHQILEQIANTGIENWNTERITKQIPNWKNLCIQKGIQTNDLNSSLKNIQQAINNALDDPRGRWILTPHPSHQSEFHITTLDNNQIKHFIIDRTFVDEEGKRWIIDYKTSHYDGKNLDQFLHQKKTFYQTQITYYQNALKKMFPEPLYFGLYFPLIPAWITWNN